MSTIDPFRDRIDPLIKESGMSDTDIEQKLKLTRGTISKWRNTSLKSYRNCIVPLAALLGVSAAYLLGETDVKTPASPGVTDDYVTFPVIGDVAAGYGHIAYEDWNGDNIDVPRSWLKGRQREDYFVLRVCGDSMYPQYQNGDVVLVLRQETMNRSGEIGVVIYDDDIGTLKRVEYVEGEDWMKLSPINPSYPPVTIRGERLEHCRVLGIPKYLVREISD